MLLSLKSLVYHSPNVVVDGLIMDINLRLPSGVHHKEEEEEEEEELDDDNNNMLDSEEKLNLLDGGVIGDDINGGNPNSLEEEEEMIPLQEDASLEPLAGMEFESHREAYAFYQEYSRSMGFNTAIQNSRRSKTSKEFIDAKYACSRYGTKREYEKSLNRQRNRQGGNKDDGESSTGRRTCSKTDCKACMHVKRRQDGKWIIHRFEKEHNHELLPAQAVSEQTRKIYAAMARQFIEYKNVVGLKNDSKTPYERGRGFSLETGEPKILFEFFAQMQSLNSNFFYAIDITEDQHLRNLFFVDAKSRHDYINFRDVVSFDTTYVKNKYKMPLVLFISVNQHYQPVLLGCALITDESETTLTWVMQAWLKAMGGRAPKVILTDQDKTLKSVVSTVFPTTRHCYSLWNVFGKLFESLCQLTKQNTDFIQKLENCVYMSWTHEEFDRRWQDLVSRFELEENESMEILFEDRLHWAPTYMKDVFLAGLSTSQRSESINSFFDKYIHKKTTVQEFLNQYETILQDRYDEEMKADSETWNRPPAFKSPSPFEKQVSGIYTSAIFRKFQTEVLGAVACVPKIEREDGTTTLYRVNDFDKTQEFIVTWNKLKSEVFCLCRSFEFKGFLCRHALIVLQICVGMPEIPSKYLLNRWMKEAKSKREVTVVTEEAQSRLQRYNEICQRAMKLGEEGSLSQDSYNFAIRALEDAFGKCVTINNCDKNVVETTSVTPTASNGLIGMEVENQNNRNMSKTNKKKNPAKKKKVSSDAEMMTVGAQDSLQTMDKMNSRPVTLEGYFGSQQSMQGMVQLNLMAPTRENYYGNQQTMQGLGQLNSIAPSHESYFTTQPIHGLGQMDFFRGPTGFPYSIREEPPSTRPTQMHNESSRHA
ncbi:protein FAR-RED ELONGATED HYPOCOTYL 3 isoform X2 [Impatiens glandulifera]|uniref:protein FAR-RED ELONGATED HYPOCOTYL 3 isoform X2 n=1 Tax=Impatiens glandulifera TaxID=253017 RepID=UPI001FB16DF7|nr:protein FAR-RED ELONGATED HYPOCOTYL 3 isoform X2 [Impatiens glandulifera]